LNARVGPIDTVGERSIARELRLERRQIVRLERFDILVRERRMRIVGAHGDASSWAKDELWRSQSTEQLGPVFEETGAEPFATVAMLRQFLLSDGRECAVFGVDPSLSDSVDPEFCAGWLCFEQSGERRRLGPIPKDWQTFSDTDLADLWKRATWFSGKLPLEDLDGFLEFPGV
jgi:hypothetical protein